VLEITALIHRYPELVDGGDFDGVSELFGHATMRSGDAAFPGSEVGDILRRLVHTYEDGRPSTKHVVTNVVVDVAGDAATARSYVTVWQARPDFPLQAIASVRHHDQFERVDGRWRFRERRDITDLVGDMSHHLKEAYHADAPDEPAG
jgi:hypothetical protein